MERITAYFVLARPQNMVITFLAVIVAGILAGPFNPPAELYIAALAAALIAGGANALNDYCDQDIDGINKPHRPIPAGRLTPRGALATAVALYAVGLLLSVLPGKATLLIALAAVLLLTGYSLRFKRRPISGNFVVASLGAAAFIYGGVAVGRPGGGIVPALFALLYHFGREITKDMEDEEADRAAGAVTIPIRYGRRGASAAARTSFFLLIILTPLPFILDLYGTLYLLGVLLTVDLLLALTILRVGPDASVAALTRWNRLLKVGMVCGLICLFMGRF